MATPVAETGITIPTLKYVFDIGFNNFVFLDSSRGAVISIPIFPVS
mgnify:CR=1 FL=1